MMRVIFIQIEELLSNCKIWLWHVDCIWIMQEVNVMAYESRRINDCVPVALSNYFAISYEDVDKELDDIYKSLDMSWIRESGVSNLVCRVFLSRRNYFDTKVPRRGQYKMTGIIRTVNSNHDAWHMAIVKNGIVYDTTAPNGMDLPIWRAFVQVKNICEYWVKG